MSRALEEQRSKTRLLSNAGSSVRANPRHIKGPYIFTRNPYWTVAHDLIPESSGDANPYPIWVKGRTTPYRRNNKRNILPKIESRLNLEPNGWNGSWVRWRSTSGRKETLLKHVECAQPPSLQEHFQVLKAHVEFIFPELLEPAMQKLIHRKTQNSQAALPSLPLMEHFLILRTTLMKMLADRNERTTSKNGQMDTTSPSA